MKPKFPHPGRKSAARTAALVLSLLAPATSAQAAPPVTTVRQINPTTAEVILAGQHRLTFDFYGENIFRLFRDDAGGIVRDPVAEPPARILADHPRHPAGALDISSAGAVVTVRSRRIAVEIDTSTSLLKVTDLLTHQIVLEQIRPATLEKGNTTLVFKEQPDEYFYGGGMQNGRFSHKGHRIAIENQNSWTDGGVASPTPFYWSTRGYGILWHTFKPGSYDFGAATPGEVEISHESDYLDVFVMVDAMPAALLRDFYQLTGDPVLLPKFGFYQGHLNAYNRDYWKEDPQGPLFEDGKHYKESQKDEGGIKESLNGEKDNYQFSARAVMERYRKHDMPLGWILPNDGYGAGYGQTDTLDGNIANLAELGDHARSQGIEIGLWTQSDLHPKPDVDALLQRDLVKEVRDAGVRVLKTDVAWVGAGYSFGLNGVADAARMMTYYGNNSRPFIISLDGWAGTQRYAGIWSGDQTGGQWEYIRFHIPTYLGSGLSGQPNVGSDMDGIFGGKQVAVNTRDYQWKTFTPIELNMDGWGANEKYPHALGEPATSINRWYLKMKSELLPYTYSIAHEAVDGLPMVRAMFLGYPDAHTLGTATRYQFLYGPYFLVAPIYQETRASGSGDDIRNGIYLPDGGWIDRFTGELYQGGRIINEFPSPLWKLPLFVKQGAIIPLAEPNNQLAEISKSKRIYEFYPHGATRFTEYDDDGTTEAYKSGAGVTTDIESSTDDSGRAVLTIHPAHGGFDGFVKEKSTELRVNLTAKPTRVMATVNGRELPLAEAATLDGLAGSGNAWHYEAAPELNRFATPGSAFASRSVKKNPVMHVKLATGDITTQTITVTVEGYTYQPADPLLANTGALTAPEGGIPVENIASNSLKPAWKQVANADYYEIEFGGMVYSTIRGREFTFEDLKPETTYQMKLRAVNRAGASEWTALVATTKSDPLEFAVKGISAKSSAPGQGGQGIDKLFDLDESTSWHTQWGEKAVPFEFTVNLKSVNQLDKLVYLPRTDAGNGTLLKGAIYHAMDRSHWTKAGDFEWAADNTAKSFSFTKHPQAGYLKFEITSAKGDFGSGRELQVFKVPGSESYIPGDINHDGRIDRNDLTSYRNYTGLRVGDADFDGYISKGDIDNNSRIDAYDISAVTTQLDGGVSDTAEDGIAGSLALAASKPRYTAGETVEITVSGAGLRAVNALGLALPYDAKDYEFVRIRPLHLKAMEDLTLDRLHTDGAKVLYPTFVNIGEQETLAGDEALFVIEFKAKKDIDFNLKPSHGVLVDPLLGKLEPWEK